MVNYMRTYSIVSPSINQNTYGKATIMIMWQQKKRDMRKYVIILTKFTTYFSESWILNILPNPYMSHTYNKHHV